MISILIAVLVLVALIWILTQVPLPAPWGNILIGVVIIGFLIFFLQGGIPKFG